MSNKANYISLFTFLVFGTFHTSGQTMTSNPIMEIKKDRNMYSKIFLKENGIYEAIISSAPVHYQNQGKWEDIDTKLITLPNGYQNLTNLIQSHFPLSIGSSNKMEFVINATDHIIVHSEKQLVWLNDENELNVLGSHSAGSMANVSDNRIKYPEIYENISDEYTLMNGSIKNDVILSSPPGLLSTIPSGYFGFREKLELPLGWSIEVVTQSDPSVSFSSLHILDANGEHQLTIPSPVFYDSEGIKADCASEFAGKYLIDEENGVWNVTTLVPVEWLKDPNTIYPVTIDPTLVIPGTTGGWQSPNNWVDNPAFVFIGVCCANLTHRAWIKFNTSAIPDGTCIQTTELQMNVSTVANNTAELTHIMDVTGAFGPYGGIVPAAYNDMGTGLYTSFTITTVGVYGYYTLGASANALLQAQLPLNWFQPALIFNNEPSTNYKIINGTTSNLRVTYPCALPVELISFDAECDNGRARLNWSTSSQINNDYFTIEKTTDGINYELVTTIDGAGNSNQTLDYSFVDPTPLTGTTYYSIKQTDYDGHYEYLDLVTVNCDQDPELTVYPNPGSGIFTIEGSSGDKISITDVFGKIIYQDQMIATKREIDLSDQLDGIYFIQVSSKKGMALQKIILHK